MDIYRLGSTIVEPHDGWGEQYITDILINPGEQVYMYITGFAATDDEIRKYRRDVQNMCKYLNHQQRVQEELFERNGC